MATTPEGRVKKAVVKALQKYGIYHFFPATHGFGRSGVPDIVGCYRGRFLSIECKAGKNVPTALQEREMKAIRAAWGTALVISSEELAERFIDRYVVMVELTDYMDKHWWDKQIGPLPTLDEQA